MGIYDDTFKKYDIKVKVNCYNDMGGSITSFYAGDIVPTRKLNNDFEDIAFYGENYNIFDYNADYILIIRYGMFIELKPSFALRYEEVVGYLCIDKYGNELELRTPQDYYDLARETAELNKKKKEFLIGFSNFLNGNEPVIRKKTLAEIVSDKVKCLIKKHG